jgi:ABC-type multidrug transport system ATPase subunit
MSKPAAEAQGLRKAPGEVQALDGLSLAAPAGAVLGLLRPNGPGKTTTVGHFAASRRRPRLRPHEPLTLNRSKQWP